jgi:hypothetical protein
MKYIGGTRERSWLRHYATSREVEGSIPGRTIGFFQLSFQPHYGPGIDSVSDRNEYQNVPGA